ncbi:hypothetical protein SPRG_04523 [Saprolegnia parasitica CBS 223.65]|uniref:inositol-1,3,4-trisphosphate 5/6-kinase n=1 Tax=Saprolegnia parasitica (strain CBS 223.65) TaxID=695850 RepID=A0A067CJD6_SAPPC|nr:hypothetical protein SPRG_04523 [Saprolegnia parasitica CBS 223.65]KDO30623.1 hypothetical protein SPRG_04523 [Saprolegnia parasitica CBS 223.65]|eukprot:XP_012198834.1 hypothetical protein SPRG_04523 [Saprolegnia parasitica CBS 223.65]
MAIMHEYIRKHPHVRIVDPLAGVRLLTNRRDVCAMLATLASTSGLPFSIPNHAIIESQDTKRAFLAQVAAGTFSLPVIVKSFEACGTDASHMMKVISCVEDVEALAVDGPLLFQEFVNHDGRLYKGYVLGPTILVSERVSLPNLERGGAKSVEFDTQSPFPTAASFAIAPAPVVATPPTAISAALTESLHAIGRAIQDATQLSLFGFDVIIDARTGQHLVIDVNYFPSFKELPDFDARMRSLMRQA